MKKDHALALNILNALNEIYNLCNERPAKFSLIKLLRDNNLGYTTAISSLLNENFLSRTPEGPGYYYYWKGIKPNIKTAEKMIDKAREINNKYSTSSAKSKKLKQQPEYTYQTTKIKEDLKPNLMQVEKQEYNAFKVYEIKKQIKELKKEMKKYL